MNERKKDPVRLPSKPDRGKQRTDASLFFYFIMAASSCQHHERRLQKMTNNNLFTALNDLDTATDGIEISLDLLGFILENLDKAATGARKGDPDAATFFLHRYEYFGRMLFLILDQVKTQNTLAQDLLGQAWKAFRKEGDQA